MSSAQVQQAPYAGQDSPVSSRHYPPSADANYGQQTANASPTSSRRHTRRPSGNSNVAHQQQQQYYSPANTNNNSPATQHHRHQQSTDYNSSIDNNGSGDYHRGQPPVAPPRVSSHNSRQSGAALAAAVSATPDRPSKSRGGQTADERAIHAARIATGDGSADAYQREDRQTNGYRDKGYDSNTNKASQKSERAGRRAQQPPTEQVAQAQRSSRNQAQRTDTNGVQDTTDVLARLVVSEPEVDLQREKERMAEATPHHYKAPEPVGGDGNGSGMQDEPMQHSPPGERRRQDHSQSKKEKNTRFGEYYLGNTLGEGEFGKVKMGWKQEGGVQVAIKLIRRDSVGGNPARLAKIYREIAILREISHPNIVRLHEMVETEKHIGIILEYASGGELFDYILNHRYLKDNAARRLFAQLVSGVGYLHKKGIVHRDLKLENLLLDRNRNIIITDFGFANTFNPADELTQEVEAGLGSRDYVKRMGLDEVLPGGWRRGDLMQTSCGSPCYAAPELVVSDSLYTGRKVDVWSCGVILYAMLAGYLPFDDDPANPEGDNINLLYKYIVSTPLTFPEYVTPHARDLLRRILVPDPRKRADLFEVARHSWLSEYSHVVGFITSNTTTPADIQDTAIRAPDERSDGAPLLARSASVREPTKTQKPVPVVGELGRKHGNVDDADEIPKATKDAKRRTLQVEYVAPRQQTIRGEDASGSKPHSSSGRRDRAGSQGGRIDLDEANKPLPQAPAPAAVAKPKGSRAQRESGGYSMPPPVRPNKDMPRAVSDNAFMAPLLSNSARPNTGGSMVSQGSMGGRHYSQTAAPTVATTTAHGRMSQPMPSSSQSNGKRYDGRNASGVAQDDSEDYVRRSQQSGVPPKFARISGMDGPQSPPVSQPISQSSSQHGVLQAPQTSSSGAPERPGRSHKRSSTISSMTEKIFGRKGSIFGGSANAPQEEKAGKSKKYPPVSYTGQLAGDGGQQQQQGGVRPRPSVDSRRSMSFGFGKKRSGSVTGSTGGDSAQGSGREKANRRFSLLPGGFSFRAIGLGKNDSYDTRTATPSEDGQYYESAPAPNAGSRERATPPVAEKQRRPQTTGTWEPQPSRYSPLQDQREAQKREQQLQQQRGQQLYDGTNEYDSRPVYRPQTQGTGANDSGNDSYGNLTRVGTQQAISQNASQRRQQQGHGYDFDDSRQVAGGAQERRSNAAYDIGIKPQQGQNGRGVLQKNNRRFVDAYGEGPLAGESGAGYGFGQQQSQTSGSSGAARRVMDFFRRRGRDRQNE